MNRPSKPSPSRRQESKTWKRYSTACIALAGAAVQEAEGAILYTSGVNLTINNSTSGVLYFDLDRSGAGPSYAGISTNVPGSADFNLQFHDPETPILDIWTSYGEAAGYSVYFPGPFPLNRDYLGKHDQNDMLGSSLNWENHTVKFMERGYVGAWKDGGMGFAALRIESSSSPGNYNYGWARIDYDDANSTMTLVDFAYETTLNQGINAGDTGAGVVPEPSRAFLLALGLGGTLLRRRRQKA